MKEISVSVYRQIIHASFWNQSA